MKCTVKDCKCRNPDSKVKNIKHIWPEYVEVFGTMEKALREIREALKEMRGGV